MTIGDSETYNVIHKSKWAISKRVNDKIRKVFLQDAYPKIRKEVHLLQLSLGKGVQLFFDDTEKHWVCESDYLDLRPLTDVVQVEEMISQLRNVISSWENNQHYNSLITDVWTDNVVPWYCTLLNQYLPCAEDSSSWLHNTHGEHFVHGDFTLSNVYVDRSGKIVVIDFENATLGPLLWDETTLVYSLIEQKQYTLANQLFEAFSCERKMLLAICSIRLAQTIRKALPTADRSEAYRYVFQNY